MTKQILMQLVIEYFAPIAATALTGLVSWVLAEAVRLIRKKTKNETVNSALARVAAMTETTVAELSQLAVEEMKAHSGGKLSKDDMAELRATALFKVQQRLTPAVLSAVEKEVTDLRGFILARIEQAVLTQKQGALVSTMSEAPGKE